MAGIEGKVPEIDPKSNAIRVDQSAGAIQEFILDATGLQRLSPPTIGEILAENLDERVATSYLGTPVYSNIEFVPAIFTDLDGNETVFDGLTINTVLMTVSMKKNIIKTKISGKPGTTKEFISDGDFDITVNGALITESTLLNPFMNRYPREQVKALFEAMKAQETITVRSRYLQQYEINTVVVEDYKFPQTTGSRDKQVFSIKMVSDTDLLLEEVETQV